MNFYHSMEQMDYGAQPYVVNMERAVIQNQNFRTTIWTGCHLQATLMCIPPCGEIGLEIHPETDQFIRIESGNGFVKMGECKNNLTFQQNLCHGDVVFIPAGHWHNIMNCRRIPLKLSVLYAPPNHPKGTVHHTKTEAEQEEY